MTKRINAPAIAMFFFLIGCISSASSEQQAGALAWYQMPEACLQTRWYTYENRGGEKGSGGKDNFGRKGAPVAPIPAGETLVLMDVKGSGTIRRIWSTLHDRSPKAVRSLKIQIYWDGAETPAVNVPWSDFFCHALGQMTAFENACFSSPEGRSFNCFIPMPFKKSAKVLLVNESDEDNYIYYELDCTLGDSHDDNMLYFHSYWRRGNYTQLRKDMDILPEVKGRGRFLGCNIGTRLHPSCQNFWWGEGEVKIYLDGDEQYPTLCGTGTEDYIGTAYGQGVFDNAYQGNQFMSGEGDPKAYGYYRFHIPDPVYFYSDIRVTIQILGGPLYKELLKALDEDSSLRFMKAGKSGEYYTREELDADPGRFEVMERIDDVCATAYWYMDRPENGLPPLVDVTERIKDLP